MSLVYYFSEWDTGISCSGPPASMYIIDERDIGPLSFQWSQTQTSAPGVCGFSILTMENGCCKGSLDVPSSISESMMTCSEPIENSDEAFVYWTPSTAIGSKYCKLTYETAPDISIIRYLLDDGKCRDSIQCLDGVVYISQTSTECPGENAKLLLNAEFSELLNSSVYIESVKITTGGQVQLWNGFYPLELNIIYPNTPERLFFTILIVIGMSSSILAIVFLISKIIYNPTRRRLYIPVLVTQLVAISASAVTAKFYFDIQTGEEQLLILMVSTTILQVLTSLLLTFNNVRILLNVFKGTFNFISDYLVYGLVFALHMILAWPFYVSHLIYEYSFVNTWFGVGNIWIGLALHLNFVCLLSFLRFRIKRTQNIQRTLINEIFMNHFISFVLLSFQVLNLVWFVVAYILKTFTLSLGNDINLMLIEVFSWLPLPLDSLMTIFLYDMAVGDKTEPDGEKSFNLSS